jgi:hypothetical protein
MPSYEIELDRADLELLGTDKPVDVETVLEMLAEVALCEVVEPVLLPSLPREGVQDE